MDEETQDLITQFKVDDACTNEELMGADEDIPVCDELDEYGWDRIVLDEVCASSSKSAHAKDVDNIIRRRNRRR